MLINLTVIFFILGLGVYFLQFEKTNYSVNSDRTPYTFYNSKRKQYIILISIILILQSGLRHWAVGADTYAYYLIFEKIKFTSWSRILDIFKDYYAVGEGKDPGYSIFQKLIQYIIKDYQLYLLLIAVLFFSALGHFIYKNTTRLTDAILAFILYSTLFYGFFSITGARQTIVTAATLYGYELIKKRKFIPFLLLLIVTSTIHKSTLVFAPFYFLYAVKSKKLIYIFILVLLPVLFINRILISDFFKTIAGYENYGIYEEAGTPTFTLMMVLIGIGSFLSYNNVVKLNPQAPVYYLAFSLALFFMPLTWVNPSAMRAVQYFSIFMLLLIPEVIHSFVLQSVKWKNLFFMLAIVTLIGLHIQSSSDSESEYKFFWQQMELGENYLYKRAR